MPEKTLAGLTRHDVATLADGTGNISDETATRLATFISSDPRFADTLATLRQMADDAGVKYLADGLEIHQLITRLRQESWKVPRELVNPALDVPYPQLLTLTATLAERARGQEKAALTALEDRLLAAFSAEVADEPFFETLVVLLSPVGENAAEKVLARLVRHYRRLRKAHQEEERAERAVG